MKKRTEDYRKIQIGENIEVSQFNPAGKNFKRTVEVIGKEESEENGVEIRYLTETGYEGLIYSKGTSYPAQNRIINIS